MKIESSSPDSHIGSVAGGPQKAAEKPSAGPEAAAAAGAAAQTPAPAGVTVTLSSTATQAMSAAGSSGNEVFNADKVEAMKAAIADGSFKVNAEAIADKMLSNAAEMLSSSSGGTRA
ncbi:MAG: flagellar biosynthesis anti-sigma factor FlgM [Hydrogenophaga sp.]|uniref:flagellar biosynthesis anti-sigma factor FlgM n=1 Tax=Hydrogenophaga sp. TaxID=1904254 RepID=UPI0025B9ABB4|nr:flagellar biosynthesis anti-sigma factor FlgM [Hydrogenophaga sp.]MBT9551814.1 flagellar biosynthesis anti-sigma factor FlgM [Hydrogenophaga sp.]